LFPKDYKELTSGYNVEMANKKASRANKTRKQRRVRRTIKRRNLKSHKARKALRRSRRQRGGSYLEATSRPFFSTVYPNSMQSAYANWTGAQPNNYPAPSPAENHKWEYTGQGIGQAFNSNIINEINRGWGLMAASTPYNPMPLAATGAGANAGTATLGMAQPTPAYSSTGSATAAAPVSSIAAAIAAGKTSVQTF